MASSENVQVTKVEHMHNIIPMPEVFTKLTGNLIQRMLTKDIRKVLYQLGLGYQFATEAIIHAVNQHMDLPNIDISLIDLQNAFNNADREIALINIKDHLPALYPYARAMYINPSKLFIFDPRVIRKNWNTTEKISMVPAHG